MRERLIELIRNEVVPYFAERIADLLLANGVAIPARCKDCKHWLDYWVAPDGFRSHGYCHLEDSDDVVVGRWDDDYCSYGERKDK